MLTSRISRLAVAAACVLAVPVLALDGQVIATAFWIAAPEVDVGKFVVFAVIETRAYDVYAASVPDEPVLAAVSVVVQSAK